MRDFGSVRIASVSKSLIISRVIDFGKKKYFSQLGGSKPSFESKFPYA